MGCGVAGVGRNDLAILEICRDFELAYNIPEKRPAYQLVEANVPEVSKAELQHNSSERHDTLQPKLRNLELQELIPVASST